jgi:hypothetical protein
MTRFLFRDSILRKILIVAVGLLASAWVPTPALAQHGGHLGGGGHFNGGARMGVPHVFAPASHTRISRGPVGFGTGHFPFRRRLVSFSAIPCSLGRRFSGLAWDSIPFGGLPVALSGPGDLAVVI